MSLTMARRHGLLSVKPCPLLHSRLPAPPGETTPPSPRPASASPSSPPAFQQDLRPGVAGRRLSAGPQGHGKASHPGRERDRAHPDRRLPLLHLLLLRGMEERGIHLRMPAGSLIHHGAAGGSSSRGRRWRNPSSTVSPGRCWASGRPNAWSSSRGGAPILYTTCPRHHFHIPVYSRVLIRDPDTLEPVPEGTPGLVDLLTPMTASMPLLSVMTDDLGVLTPPGPAGVASRGRGWRF